MKREQLSVTPAINRERISRYRSMEKSTSPVNSSQSGYRSVKHNKDLPRLSLVPIQIIYEIAEVRSHESKLFGASPKWRQEDVAKYRDEAFQFLLSYMREPSGINQESGLPYLSHLANVVAILCDLEQNGVS